jgi:membrane dipeptidase
LESQQKIRLITNLADLQHHLNAWQATSTNQPIGLIISMEGADPIVNPQQVPSWYADGLRIVGLSHYGISAYAHGTGTKGGLTDQGASLLKAMEENGIILDLTHLADQAFWEALDHYSGPVLASHNNCRTLVPGDRQFSDAQLHALIQRGGVIGTALDAWMLYPNWIKEQTPNTVVDLNAVANHIDYICQLAGNANHAAIGSDLDGGYGTEQCPHDLDTIADLQKVALLLDQRGYTKPDIEAVMHGNWIRFFSAAWS